MLCTCYTYIYLAVCDVLYKKLTFHETDATESETSAETEAEELEEDDCQETEDLRSCVCIEHGQNEEEAASNISSHLVSNTVNVATAMDVVRKIARIIRKSILSRAMLNLKIVTCYLIARQDRIV